MVSAVRRGQSLSKVAAGFGVSRSTVRHWVNRAHSQRLDRVDFSDRPPGRREPVNRTARETEDLVLSARRELKECSALGEFGAEAIHRELWRRRVASIPSVRTIGRILDRRGALDGRRRTRRPAPPAGWYLPRLAEHCVELDSFDIVEGLVIQGGLSVEVLTGVSLHGGLAEAWPRAKITAKTVVSAIVAYWRRFGLPAYAQFDNDTVFQGPHQHRDVIGRVTRLCLSLDVVPVFAPPRETGFQAAIENFNGAWQAKVWNRFHFSTRGELTSRSRRFITAHRRRRAARVDGAPARRPLLDDWSLDLQKIIDGRIIYLRRTSDTGTASLLGHTFPVDRNWPHRLVRAEVDLKSHRICFYALRRRDTSYQPMLKEIDHEIPRRKFHE